MIYSYAGDATVDSLRRTPYAVPRRTAYSCTQCTAAAAPVEGIEYPVGDQD
eukprot:SAG11_NODE_21712_length_420_cov_0.638629_1_plen_50_part_10